MTRVLDSTVSTYRSIDMQRYNPTGLLRERFFVFKFYAKKSNSFRVESNRVMFRNQVSFGICIFISTIAHCGKY